MKQILQLGMGDTFDDWLVEKIQLLRKGRIVAFAVKRVEQVSVKSLAMQVPRCQQSERELFSLMQLNKSYYKTF